MSDSLSIIFLEICRSDSSLQNLVFNSFRSFFSSSKILLNFPWWSSNILTKSSLFKLIREDSVQYIFQVAKEQVQISSTKKICLQSFQIDIRPFTSTVDGFLLQRIFYPGCVSNDTLERTTQITMILLQCSIVPIKNRA